MDFFYSRIMSVINSRCGLAASCAFWIFSSAKKKPILNIFVEYFISYLDNRHFLFSTPSEHLEIHKNRKIDRLFFFGFSNVPLLA